MKPFVISEVLDLQTNYSCTEIRTRDGHCYVTEYAFPVTDKRSGETVGVKISMPLHSADMSTTQRTFIDLEQIVVMNVVENRTVLKQKFAEEALKKSGAI